MRWYQWLAAWMVIIGVLIFIAIPGPPLLFRLANFALIGLGLLIMMFVPEDIMELFKKKEKGS